MISTTLIKALATAIISITSALLMSVPILINIMNSDTDIFYFIAYASELYEFPLIISVYFLFFYVAFFINVSDYNFSFAFDLELFKKKLRTILVNLSIIFASFLVNSALLYHCKLVIFEVNEANWDIVLVFLASFFTLNFFTLYFAFSKKNFFNKDYMAKYINIIGNISYFWFFIAFLSQLSYMIFWKLYKSLLHYNYIIYQISYVLFVFIIAAPPILCCFIGTRIRSASKLSIVSSIALSFAMLVLILLNFSSEYNAYGNSLVFIVSNFVLFASIVVLYLFDIGERRSAIIDSIYIIFNFLSLIFSVILISEAAYRLFSYKEYITPNIIFAFLGLIVAFANVAFISIESVLFLLNNNRSDRRAYAVFAYGALDLIIIIFNVIYWTFYF